MSRITDLGEHNQMLPTIVAEYDDALDNVKEKIEIKGKKLEAANVENAAWQHYYDQKRVELHTLTKYFESERDRVYGKLFRKFKENHSIELGGQEIKRYIESEDEYLRMNGYYLEIKELYEKYEAVVKAFSTRGYALNNITKIRVASLEDVEL